VNEKLVGKIAFTLGVINLVLTVWLFAGLPVAFCYFYSVKMFALFALRFYLYYKQKFHYFMLDFCYFGNILLFVFLWALPASFHERGFFVVWGVINGPVAWAVVAFGNSLVFHSVDKITSLFLHLTPALVLFDLRWKRSDSQRWAVCVPDVSSTAPCQTLSYQLLYIVGGGCLYFVAHQVFYYIVVQCFCMNCNTEFKEGKTADGQDAYWTSFRWLTKKKDAPMSRFVFSMGNTAAPFLYGLTNLAYAAVTMLLSLLWYHYMWAHLLFGAGLMLYATWSGANFYYEVFSASQGHGKAAKPV